MVYYQAEREYYQLKRLRNKLTLLVRGNIDMETLYNWCNNNCYCALCGRKLSFQSELIPTPCSCKKAQDARAHNERIAEELAMLANQANTATDQQSFSLAELLSVVSGCVICRVEPIFTEEKVYEKIQGNGSAKEKVLNNVTPEQAQNLCAAAEELVAFLKAEHLAWEADISPKLGELADKYQLPLEFTF